MLSGSYELGRLLGSTGETKDMAVTKKIPGFEELFRLRLAIWGLSLEGNSHWTSVKCGSVCRVGRRLKVFDNLS